MELQWMSIARRQTSPDNNTESIICKIIFVCTKINWFLSKEDFLFQNETRMLAKPIEKSTAVLLFSLMCVFMFGHKTVQIFSLGSQVRFNATLLFTCYS